MKGQNIILPQAPRITLPKTQLFNVQLEDVRTIEKLDNFGRGFGFIDALMKPGAVWDFGTYADSTMPMDAQWPYGHVYALTEEGDVVATLVKTPHTRLNRLWIDEETPGLSWTCSGGNATPKQRADAEGDLEEALTQVIMAKFQAETGYSVGKYRLLAHGTGDKHSYARACLILVATCAKKVAEVKDDMHEVYPISRENWLPFLLSQPIVDFMSVSVTLASMIYLGARVDTSAMRISL